MNTLASFHKVRSAWTGKKSSAGALVISLGTDPQLLRAAIEDTELIAGYAQTVDFRNARSAGELVEIVDATSPQVVFLLADVDKNGQLQDTGTAQLPLSELMKASDRAGVRLFVISSQNNFDHVQVGFYSSREMSFMTITDRNRHYPAFVRGLLEGLGSTSNFATAYTTLAPQREMAQKGRPLPGSIAVCPVKKGKDLVLWSEPQP